MSTLSEVLLDKLGSYQYSLPDVPDIPVVLMDGGTVSQYVLLYVLIIWPSTLLCLSAELLDAGHAFLSGSFIPLIQHMSHSLSLP